jgi:hypothetical protein
MAVGIRHSDNVAPSIWKSWQITSPTRGGCSVGIVRSQTLIMEFCFCFFFLFQERRCCATSNPYATSLFSYHFINLIPKNTWTEPQYLIICVCNILTAKSFLPSYWACQLILSTQGISSYAERGYVTMYPLPTSYKTYIYQHGALLLHSAPRQLYTPQSSWRPWFWYFYWLLVPWCTALHRRAVSPCTDTTDTIKCVNSSRIFVRFPCGGGLEWRNVIPVTYKLNSYIWYSRKI